MPKNKFGISDLSFEQLQKALTKYSEVKYAKIFGSRAINTFKNGSDIDIALMGENVNQTTIDKLNNYIDEETVIPYYIDFICYNTLNNETLKEHIDTFGLTFYVQELQ